MRSFVKPFARAKFGVAAASTAALIASPLGAMPANAAADYTIDFGACDNSIENALKVEALIDAIWAANANPGAEVIEILATQDCTVTINNETMRIYDDLTMQNASGFDFNFESGPRIGSGYPMLTLHGDIGYDIENSVSYDPITLVIDGLDFVANESYTGLTSPIDLGALYAKDSDVFLKNLDIEGFVTVGPVIRTYYYDDRTKGVDLTLENVYFHDNASFSAPLAMYYDSELTIIGSRFVGNEGYTAGAIYLHNSTVDFEGEAETRFTDNSSYQGGGAIRGIALADDAVTLVAHSPLYFYNNQTGADNTDNLFGGGAIDFVASSTSTLAFNKPVTFKNNSVTATYADLGQQSLGGAIRFVTTADMATTGLGPSITFNDPVTFEGNYAVKGGAIAVYQEAALADSDPTEVSVFFNDTATFDGNSADDGGAIWLDTEDTSGFFGFYSTTTFDGNTATSSGGAIYSDNDGIDHEFYFYGGTSTYFLNNTAGDDGGAIYMYTDTQSIGESHLIFGTEESYAALVRFEGNTAVDDGGAIHMFHYDEEPYYGRMVLEIYSDVVAFRNNSAGDDGGAIHSLGTSDVDYGGRNSLVIKSDSASFAFNNAGDDGGAIYAEDVDITLVGGDALMYFGYNTSGDNGGALYINEGFQYIVRANFFNNSSSEDGGAIYGSDLDEFIMGYSDFTGNSAGSEGGALYIQFDSDGNFNVRGNYFYGNDAVTDGGAIHFEGYESSPNVLIAENMFVANFAASDGGAIDFDEQYFGSVDIYANTFVGNRAYSGDGGAIDGVSPLYDDENVMFNIRTNTFAYNYASDEGGALWLGPDNWAYLVSNTFVGNYASSGDGHTVWAANENYTVKVEGNIIASEQDYGAHLFSVTNYFDDRGGNLISGDDEGAFGVALPIFACSTDGESAMVTWEQLDLQPLAVNDSNPENIYPWSTIALGANSVAIDYLTVSGIAVATPPTDQRGVIRNLGNAVDAGAFESEFTATSTGYVCSTDQVGITPNVVIMRVSKSSIAAAGDTFSVYGRGLDDTTEVFVGGVKVSFQIVSATELLVTTGALSVGSKELRVVATDGTANLQMAVATTDEASYWTKNLGNGQAKIYAKNIVGEGKVQFFVNGKEIAWINAVDETDPKLRKANGASYLVRTVNLVAGKNRLEVKVDGVRVRFTTYSR